MKCISSHLGFEVCNPKRLHSVMQSPICVLQVGDGVTKFREGQRVIPVIALAGMRGNGSFQKYLCIDARFVLPAPDDMSDEAAAQFVVNPWTAYSMLKDLNVPRGEYMIQSAAGSTLGKQMISLANHWGIKTINVVRRAEQKAELQALGADEVICSTDEDVVARAKEITGGRGAWGALDAVGGAMTGTLAASVRDDGQVFLYGVLSGFSTTLDSMDLIRGVSVTGWVLYRRGLSYNIETLATEVALLITDGIIKVAQVEKYDLTDFKQAIAKAAEPARSAKILLVTA